MLFLLTFLACEDHIKAQQYDISSTVLVADEDGQLLSFDTLICQRFTSQDYDTRTQWTVLAEQCDEVNVEAGIARLPNWEGAYFGPDVGIEVMIVHKEEIYPANLVDDDSDVWCDNVEAIAFDEDGNPTEWGSECEDNYERFLLWQVVLPSELF